MTFGVVIGGRTGYFLGLQSQFYPIPERSEPSSLGVVEIDQLFFQILLLAHQLVFVFQVVVTVNHFV
ncbi:hypothetical protein KKA69_04765 [Patescibacteria group bacterium]|nr:hypothetical protein [Patescibacteria group bacterium]